jgi:hypothetical protein
MLHKLPTANDRALIHDLVRFNALGLVKRHHRDAEISRIMGRYGITKLHLDGYSVHLVNPICTPKGIFPVVDIRAERKSPNKHCPACGGRPGYLDGDRVVTVGCQSCGTVYKFAGGEVSENPTSIS